MSSAETEDRYKWIIRYQYHHLGKYDVKEKRAVVIAPVAICIVASNLISNILQSGNGGEFLSETIKAVNR